jgi:CspA family cold shock protein
MLPAMQRRHLEEAERHVAQGERHIAEQEERIGGLEVLNYMIALGRVSWFKLDKNFGFVELEGGVGDAFLHVSVLKAAGYVSIPAGTTVRVRLETQSGRLRLTASQRRLSAKTPNRPLTLWSPSVPPVVPSRHFAALRSLGRYQGIVAVPARGRGMPPTCGEGR